MVGEDYRKSTALSFPSCQQEVKFGSELHIINLTLFPLTSAPVLLPTFTGMD